MTVSGFTMTSDDRQSVHTAGEPNPQQPVGCLQARAFLRGVLQHADLMPECDIFQLQRSAGLQDGCDSGEEKCEPSGDRTKDVADEVQLP